MTTDTPSQYSEGYAARMQGAGLDSCPYGMADLERRHWWTAGWHDADIELQSSTKRFGRVGHG